MEYELLYRSKENCINKNFLNLRKKSSNCKKLTSYSHLHKKIEKSKLFQQKLDFLLKKEIILDKKIHKVEIRKN